MTWNGKRFLFLVVVGVTVKCLAWWVFGRYLEGFSPTDSFRFWHLEVRDFQVRKFILDINFNCLSLLQFPVSFFIFRHPLYLFRDLLIF